MNTNRFAISTGDIPAKGIGLLTLYDSTALREGVDELIRRGAVAIYASGPVSPGERDGLLLSHSHDHMRLSRTPGKAAAPLGRLTLKPLTRFDGALFLSIYNESIITQPFQSTQSIADLEWLLSEEWLTGIAWLGETPVGIYECQLSEGVAELRSIALLEAWRGKGLGRELLRQVLTLISDVGQITARVDTNSSAFSLLRSEGFRAEDLLASWYRVEVIPE